jgi:oligoribonuclease NrnB/cAMP/cGMP phosphodiesterase (DHH superfamily)
MSILSCSHNDLDGISAQIVLRYFVGDISRMNISYNKINEYIEIINEYCIHHKPKEVWITDLSFTLEQLEKLFEVIKKHSNVSFYFIDHHPFKEDHSHIKANNLMLLINQKASATKLTYLYLKNNSDLRNINLEELEKYVEYVNTYDLWIKDDQKFKGSLVYNELFWEFKKDYYFSRFQDEFKLRNSDKDRYRDMMNKKKKLFKKLDDSGRIFRHEPDGKKRIFMIFLDDYKNHVTIDFEGFDTYIIVSSYGGVSIRLRDNLSDDGILKDNVVKRILEHWNIETGGGHSRAFGTRLLDSSAHNQVEFAKDLLTIIDEELDNL